jgi:hypothetical protein
LTWVVEGKRLQQNRVHNAENRANGAYAQSYRQEGGQGKSRRLAQGADAHSKIQEQGLHGISHRHLLIKQARFRPDGPPERSNLFSRLRSLAFQKYFPLFEIERKLFVSEQYGPLSQATTRNP